MIDFRAREFAYLSVWSDTLSVARLSRLLGMEPEQSWSVGETFVRAGQTKVRSATSWKMGPPIPPSALIDDQLDALWERAEPVLKRIDPVVDDVGCGLMIVQNMSDDVDEKHGLTIDARWTELLGLAGGSVVIDQYVG